MCAPLATRAAPLEYRLLDALRRNLEQPAERYAAVIRRHLRVAGRHARIQVRCRVVGREQDERLQEVDDLLLPVGPKADVRARDGLGFAAVAADHGVERDAAAVVA